MKQAFRLGTLFFAVTIMTFCGVATAGVSMVSLAEALGHARVVVVVSHYLGHPEDVIKEKKQLVKDLEKELYKVIEGYGVGIYSKQATVLIERVEAIASSMEEMVIVKAEKGNAVDSTPDLEMLKKQLAQAKAELRDMEKALKRKKDREQSEWQKFQQKKNQRKAEMAKQEEMFRIELKEVQEEKEQWEMEARLERQVIDRLEKEMAAVKHKEARSQSDLQAQLKKEQSAKAQLEKELKALRAEVSKLKQGNAGGH